MNNFERICKNEWKFIDIGGTEIENHKFHQYKSPISIRNIDINKVIVSNTVFFSKIDFECYIGSKEVIPFCMFLPKMSAYRRDFDKTKYISFLIKDHEFLEKNNEIWKKN